MSKWMNELMNERWMIKDELTNEQINNRINDDFDEMMKLTNERKNEWWLNE